MQATGPYNMAYALCMLDD